MSGEIGVRTSSLLRAFAVIAAAILSSESVGANGDPASDPPPSFPDAAGFGATTAGGRGGPIIAVTRLADSGPGTLRWALEEVEGPRIVVFAVEGEISLERAIWAKGRLTLLGQVAPGAGVTVTGAGIRIAGAEVIMRGMRIRPGGGPGHPPETRDAVSIGSRKETVENVIVDGNSLTWSTDEIIDVWHGARNITISNNIIAEALRDAGHPKGHHSMGMLIGDGAANISIIRNFFANSEFRNPTVAGATNIEVINNYVFNYGQHALSFTLRDGIFTWANVIGNHFQRGPDTGRQKALRILGAADGGAFHLRDNISADRQGATKPESPVAANIAGAALSDVVVFETSGTPVMPAAEVRRSVLSTAGARRPHLDPIDARIVSDAGKGRGRIIDAPSEVGAPPSDPASNAPSPTDRDGDFIPDAAEVRIGSDPDQPDAHRRVPGSPYAAIELYAQALIARD